jgi:YebC/PmpR family DNA-binding regulatory protein
MSGHSKWASIKHKKAIVDAKRGRLFSKLTKEIIIAARSGPDPQTNPRLRNAIEKAKSYNMPQENIKRAIMKATGPSEAAQIEEVVYEGYGPGGVAILIEALTDNRNRTTAAVRSIFSKKGGNLGQSGCVSWLFKKKGIINVDKDAIAEDELLTIMLDVGAEDVKVEDTYYEIIMDVEEFFRGKKALEERGIKPKYAQITMLPQNYVKVDNEVATKLLSLMEALEEDEDVQHVYANFDLPDEVVEKIR